MQFDCIFKQIIVLKKFAWLAVWVITFFRVNICLQDILYGFILVSAAI